MVDPASIEARARELYRQSKRDGRAKGSAPAWCWRQAIAEVGAAPSPQSEAERVNRIMREVLGANLFKLNREAQEKGWP